jgi:hypothetical protein
VAHTSCDRNHDMTEIHLRFCDTTDAHDAEDQVLAERPDTGDPVGEASGGAPSAAAREAVAGALASCAYPELPCTHILIASCPGNGTNGQPRTGCVVDG